MSARNCFEKFESAAGRIFSWLLEQHVIEEFIERAIFINDMTAGTVEAYLHCIEIIQCVKGLLPGYSNREVVGSSPGCDPCSIRK